jgi:hypothetical protein
MKADTYSKFCALIEAEWKAEGYDYDEEDLQDATSPRRWHQEHLIPFAQSGGKFAWHTMRSICGKGAWCSLSWYQVNFGSVPETADIHTGKQRPARGFDESEGTCCECGNPVVEVRPGKHQCDHCESLLSNAYSPETHQDNSPP